MTEIDAPFTACFLAECYAPASEASDRATATDRVAAACAELRARGAAIEYFGVLLVPGDELAYHVFSGADADVISQAGSRAGLRVERVVPSLAVGLVAPRASPRHALPVAIEGDRPVGHPSGEIGA
jgi:hypothetical protein